MNIDEAELRKTQSDTPEHDQKLLSGEVYAGVVRSMHKEALIKAGEQTGWLVSIIAQEGESIRALSFTNAQLGIESEDEVEQHVEVRTVPIRCVGYEMERVPEYDNNKTSIWETFNRITTASNQQENVIPTVWRRLEDLSWPLHE